MAAMAHGDGVAWRFELGGRLLKPLRHRRGAGGLDRVQPRLHAPLRLAADAQRQPDPGLHHRHRRRRHDARDRHRRHRPVGRLADGDRRRAGAADLPGQAVPAAAASPSAWPLAFVVPVLVAGMFGLFNGWLITRFRIQPIVATLVLFIAGRGIAQVLTNGDLQVVQDAGVPVHRPRPRPRHPVPGLDHGGDRRGGRLGAAAHRLRPADPGHRRQRGGGPAVRRADRARQAHGLRHQRPVSRASPG